MLKNYYNLILEKLQKLAEENKLGYIDKHNILDDPQLQSLINSVAYIAENIDKQIIESESNVYKLIISKIYKFIFQIKPSNIIVSFEPKNYDEQIILDKSTSIQIHSNEKKYTYTVLDRIEFLQIKILESSFIQYNQILNNNYFGNYFLSIKIQFFCNTENLSEKNIKLYILHENYEQILSSILKHNQPVYVYINKNLLKIGDLKINNYYSLYREIDIPKQYDYLYQYLINKKLFSFINISINKSIINCNLDQNNTLTILIPSKNMYEYKNILKYYIVPAYNYNSIDTNSFYIDNGFEKIISIDHTQDLEKYIVSVQQLFSIDKNTRNKYLYLPEYCFYSSEKNCLINNEIKWDYENFYNNNRYLTKIILIPNKNLNLENIDQQVFYAKVKYTQIILFEFFVIKIFMLQIKNIQNINLISGPTKTILYNNQLLLDNLLFVSKININNVEVFKNQIKSLLNFLFKIFKKNNNIENILQDITITFEKNIRKYSIEFLLAENYIVSIGLLISIMYFINNYFDISYSFSYKFSKKYNNYTVL